ncbi:MAG: 50S ribosomal protein L15e [Nanoarchaeota archaeon]
MGLYQYLRKNWQSSSLKERMIQWRQEPVTLRIERPTRIDRARSLGYKAKEGIFVVRQRIIRGGHSRPAMRHGRRSKHMRRVMVLSKSYQWIAEERAAKKFVNCEVLNSYFVAKDGRHYWFEVIMVDKLHPAVLHDPALAWIAQGQHTRRAFRGLTASGKRSRGILTNVGFGSEKLRPSITANRNRRK